MKLAVVPQIAELAPGDAVEFLVTITNDGDQTLRPTLTVNGVDPELLDLPDELFVLGAGDKNTTKIGVRLPADAPAGERRIGFGLTDPDGFQNEVTATTAVRVGARPDVSAVVEPATGRGRRAIRLTTVLHNRGATEIPVTLVGSGDDIEVGFALDEFTLRPGEDLQVPTRLERTRRSWFREVRHGAIIQVRGRGAPVTATATFTQRPLLAPLLMKVVAALTVLSLIAALFVSVVNPRLQAGEDLTKYLALPAIGADDLRGAGSPIDADGATLSRARVVVSGSVDGPSDPAGTEVMIEEVAFGDEGTTSGADGVKLAAFTPAAPLLGRVLARIDTSTDERGTFRFDSGLRAPAFYRVTATRPGFEIASQIARITEDEPEIELALTLVPASGGMSGLVTDGSGTPLGGATVTVTDGSLVYSARSATEGSVGTWSVSGVATPQSYQVIVANRGYATATLAVDLEGGEVRSGVNVQLIGGLGTIRGRVTYRGEGVGGVQISLTGDEADRESITLTDGPLRGSFDFPALPYGTYQLTFSAPGWLTQTSEVVVDRGDVVLNVTDLRPSTAVVQGVVTQMVAPGGGCRYPDPAFPNQRRDAEPQPCGGVGVTLVGPDTTLRTTSASGDGTFRLSGIPSGEYLVRFERFGYVSQFFDIAVEAGDILTLPDGARGPIEMQLVDPLDEAAGQLRFVLRESIDPAAVFDVPVGTSIRVVGQDQATVVPLADGAFRIDGLRPGAQTLQIKAPGYDLRSEVVRIAFSGLSDAGAIEIIPLGSLALQVTGGQSSVIADAEVFVVPDPTIYDSGTRSPPVIEPSGGVVTCTRTFLLDGRERTLAGVCASTDAVGDVEFRRNFGTGDYVFVTPTNTSDIAEEDPARRSSTVPLDHERLIRRVELSSGSTVRLDPNLRRYPIIQGSIRRVSEITDGLEGVNVTRENITLERIDPDTQTVAPLPPDSLPQPRISGRGDAGSTLGPGQYRIDRIPANDANTQYEWQLVISTDDGSFIRGLNQPDGLGPIVGLGFNETRTINGLLLPDPQPIRFRIDWENANGDIQPVPDALLRIRGISSFEPSDDPPFLLAQSTTCPSTEDPACRIESGDRAFDFTVPPTDPRVVARSVPGTSISHWLSADVGGAPGIFDMPTFYRPGRIFADFAAPGFVLDLAPTEGDDPTFRLTSIDQDGDAYTDDRPYTHEQLLVVEDRDVTVKLVLDPPVSTYPAFFDVTSDAAFFATLDVELSLQGAGPAVVVPAVLSPTAPGSGEFSVTGVTPGSYELSVTGDLIDDIVGLEVLVTPGTGPFLVGGASGVDVTRRGALRAEARGRQLSDAPVEASDPPQVLEAASALTGATIVLERLSATASTPPVPTDWLTIPAAACGTAPDPPCEDGVANYDDLDIYDGDGVPWTYRLRMSATDYVPFDEQFTLGIDPYPLFDDPLPRYGELRGTVEGRIPSRDPSNLALEGVTVTLVDFATRVPIPGVPTVSTDATGGFAFGPSPAIDQRTAPLGPRYGLRFERTGYVPRDLGQALQFAYDSFDRPNEDPVVVEALPANLSGIVTSPDGREMYNVVYVDPLLGEVNRGPGPGVHVELLTRLGTSLATTNTTGPTALPPTAAGSYALGPVDAGQDHRLVFTPVAGTPGADDFKSLELELSIDPGETRDDVDVVLPWKVAPLQGLVTGAPFEGVSGEVLEGVTVTATLTTDASVSFVTTSTGEADVNYRFDTIFPSGTYRVTFERDGYGTDSHDAVVIAPVVDAPVTLNRTLIQEQVTVEVSVTSTATQPASPLAGVEVAATYLGPQTLSACPDPADPAGFPCADDRTVTETTTTSGIAGFTLPPGEWEFTTTNTDVATFAPRPHATPDAQTFTIPFPDNDRPSFALVPYVSYSGTVVVPEGAGTAPANGVALAVLRGDVEQTAPAVLSTLDDTAIQVAWTVWLPALPEAEDDVRVRFRLQDYDDGFVFFRDHPPTQEAPLDIEVGEVQLVSSLRGVQVQLVSEAGADALSGMNLRATNVADTSLTRDARVQVVNGVAVANFSAMRQGDWTVATLDAEQLQIPHVGTSGVLTVRNQTPQTEQRFFQWRASVEGTVFGRDHANGLEYELGGVAVRLRGGTATNPVDISVTSNDTAPVGRWQVGLLERNGGTASFTKAGYASLNDQSYTFPQGQGGSSTATLDRTLTALPRTVTVPVESSAGLSLDGLSVSAVWDGGGIAPSPAPEAQPVVGAATSVEFTLAPGKWRFTTTGGPLVASAPHVDADGDVEFSAGVDGVTADTLTLQRYASVTGQVSGKDFETATTSTILTDFTVTVSATAGDAVVQYAPPPLAAGSYRVWLAAPAAGTITFTSDGYADEVIDIAVDLVDPVTGEGLVAGGDVTDFDVSLIADPIEVPVTVQSTDGAIGLLDGVSVTAAYKVSAQTDPKPPDVSATSGTATNVDQEQLNGELVLALAPGTWILTTTDAAAALDTQDPPQTRPHGDGTLEVTVGNDGTIAPDPVTLDLVPFVTISGEVNARAYAGADPSGSPADASLQARVGTSGPSYTGTVGAFTDGVADWSVAVPPSLVDAPVTWTITISATGYLPGTTTQQVVFGTSEYTAGDIELVEEPREVAVTVVSSQDADLLVGVDVTATGPSGTTPVTVRTVAGIATFGTSNGTDDRLAPATWVFTTARGDLAQVGEVLTPHVDLAPPPGASRTVPSGTGTLALDQTSGARERLTLTRYDKVAGGTPRPVAVTVVSSVGANPLANVEVTATGLGSTRFTATTNADGVALFDGTQVLEPATWVFSTTKGVDATIGVDTPTLTPHLDVSYLARTIPDVGAATLLELNAADERLTLTRYASVSGTVNGRNYDGDAATELIGATVTVTGDVGPFVLADAMPLAGADYLLWLAEPGAGEIVFNVPHYGEATLPVPSGLVVGGNATDQDVTLTAIPRTLTVTVYDDAAKTTPVEGAQVFADPAETGDDLFVAPLPAGTSAALLTDAQGQAVIELAPGGTWDVNANLEVEGGPDKVATAVSVGVTLGTTLTPIELVLEENSKLFGSVFELRGADRVAIPDVRIRAVRDTESFSTISTEPDQNGENYRLQARAGTWRITASRSDETIVVDEAFEIRQDGPDSERNVLDIVLPTRAIDVSGRVLGAGSTGLQGAEVTAVSAVGAVTSTSDEDGRYSLAGLDNRVTWAVTFSPPEGEDGRAVTRYLALSGEFDVDITLDQTLPAGLGTLELTVTGGEPGIDVEVVLTEVAPFPTLNADARLERTVQLGEDGSAVVAFEDLVPGDGTSVPQDRFTLWIAASGYDPVTRDGLDVTPNGTTQVVVDLGGVGVLTRTVELGLFADSEPLLLVDARLQQGSMILGPPTSPPDSNTYTFAAVEPGSWQVVVDGFEEQTITVPAGSDGVYAITLTLVPLLADDDPATVEDEGSEDGAEVGTDEAGAGDTAGDGPDGTSEDRIGEVEDPEGSDDGTSTGGTQPDEGDGAGDTDGEPSPGTDGSETSTLDGADGQG